MALATERKPNPKILSCIWSSLVEMSYVHSDPSTISRSSTIQKWEQAFIVLVPISIATILLLFYFYYLRRQRGLESGLASSESNNNDISKVSLISICLCSKKFVNPFCAQCEYICNFFRITHFVTT